MIKAHGLSALLLIIVKKYKDPSCCYVKVRHQLGHRLETLMNLDKPLYN